MLKASYSCPGAYMQWSSVGLNFLPEKHVLFSFLMSVVFGWMNKTTALLWNCKLYVPIYAVKYSICIVFYLKLIYLDYKCIQKVELNWLHITSYKIVHINKMHAKLVFGVFNNYQIAENKYMRIYIYIIKCFIWKNIL